ncbi:MAG: cytochrome-c peroxidase [Chitinophagales bacterium]|nr:cytochrome-c peroxidase [Chitinophagales bacterium]
MLSKGYIYIGILGLLWGCTKEAPLNPSSQIEIPYGFSPISSPVDNPLTTNGIALGKRLFFDPILSADSTISCSTCHQPEKAFADSAPIAVGIDGKKGRRNSMSLINSAYLHRGLFWDGRVTTLEEQALIPVITPEEMGSDWTIIENRLRRHDNYPDLFYAAFNISDTSQITRFLTAKALAQFQRTLVKGTAKYDLEELGYVEFTPSERRGRDIFFDEEGDLPEGECAHCHLPPLFTDQTYMNNGLDEVLLLTDFQDQGRGTVTGQVYDNGRFRVPGLRNVALTAPYMHDGRFATLEEVVAHYNNGGHYSKNKDPKIINLHLSAQHQADLVNFLKTLTDTTFVYNSHN